MIRIDDFKARFLCWVDQMTRLMFVSPTLKPLRGTWKNVVRVKGDIVQFDVAEDWESSR
jgi:hypothetical protein